MKTNYIIFLIVAMLAVYSSVTTIGSAPDISLINLFGYSFGINYSHNIVLKLLFTFLTGIAIVIILQSKNNDSKEEQNI